MQEIYKKKFKKSGKLKNKITQKSNNNLLMI